LHTFSYGISITGNACVTRGHGKASSQLRAAHASRHWRELESIETHLRELGVEEALSVGALRWRSVLDGEDLVLVPEQQDLLPVLHDHAALPAGQRGERHHRHPRRAPASSRALRRRRGRLGPGHLGGAAGEPGAGAGVAGVPRRGAERGARAVGGASAVEEGGGGRAGGGCGNGRHRDGRGVGTRRARWGWV